jgi:hypothetical protein
MPLSGTDLSISVGPEADLWCEKGYVVRGAQWPGARLSDRGDGGGLF